MEWNARDNANYGFVYSSQDSGKTWRIALEDKSSKWVSEESCAFGVHGIAYFIADASSVDEVGDTHHAQGTSRIRVSHDSGRTWSLDMATGWMDSSASVVDQSPGPDQNRLYIFFNNLHDFYSSIGDQTTFAKLPKSGNSIGLIRYKDGDHRVAAPTFNPEMYKELYHGSYPSQNLRLKDGALLTLFWAKKGTQSPDGMRSSRELILAAQYTDPKREKLSDPVALYSFLDQPEEVCSSFLNAPAAYDATTNTVYAVYLDANNGKCTLMLTKSMDDGQTWSPGHAWNERQSPAPRPEEVPTENYNSLALARNQDDVMALLWRNSHTSNCWYFATSADDGQTYSHPMQISSCSPETDEKYQLSDVFLAFWGLEQADGSEPADDAGIILKNANNFGQNHVSGIAVSPDGVFHPVWTVAVNGEGQLRTAAIAVMKQPKRNTPNLPRVGGWRYRTNEVKILYGGSQHYDAQKDVLSESVIVRNSGIQTLKAPLRLEIDPDSRLGLIYPLNATTEGSGQNISQYVDISQYLPGGELAPGRSTAPIPLNFHFELYDDDKPDDNILAHISLRLLIREAK
jgi:hypothetical protein